MIIFKCKISCYNNIILWFCIMSFVNTGSRDTTGWSCTRFWRGYNWQEWAGRENCKDEKDSGHSSTAPSGILFIHSIYNFSVSLVLVLCVSSFLDFFLICFLSFFLSFFFPSLHYFFVTSLLSFFIHSVVSSQTTDWEGSCLWKSFQNSS